MKKLFITGGAGFIGSAFIHYILEREPEVEVVNFDLLTYAGNLANLAGIDDRRHKFIRGDIRDAPAVAEALPSGTEAVLNFAAESHVDRSITSAREFVTTNVLGTQVLLDATRSKNVGRFCQISTDEVMGSLQENCELFFTETSELAPNSPYAASKAAAEHLVRAAGHTFGLDTVTTRCGNNYGPRQFPEKLIPLVIANALADQSIPIYGDGKNVRDWIYVDDHCAGIWDVLTRGASGHCYNVGARNERENLDVVRAVLDAVNKPHSLIQFVKDRPGHDRRYAIDPTKIESLGWTPRESWQSGLRKTIDWYLANSDWMSHVRSGDYLAYYKRQYGVEAGAV